MSALRVHPFVSKKRVGDAAADSAGGGRIPDFGMTFGNPDFVTSAKSYGVRGSRVEGADALVPALEAAFASGGVHLVTLPVDYTENIRVLVEELRVK